MRRTSSDLSWGGCAFLCIITCTVSSLYSAKDAHNRSVKQKIEEGILLNKENSYSKVLVDSKYFQSCYFNC